MTEYHIDRNGKKYFIDGDGDKVYGELIEGDKVAGQTHEGDKVVDPFPLFHGFTGMLKSRKELKCYQATFDGHYPIGAYAVVFDYSEEEAREAVKKELEKFGLGKGSIDLEEIPIEKSVVIISDGNY